MPKTEELDWDDLRYFLRAVDAKTLAGAARALGVDHTTIGRRLSALERALGAPVVLRGPDGVQLTPVGERLLPLVREMERAALSVRQAATSERVRVRLATPSGFVRFFAQDLVELRRTHPELLLELTSGARPVNLEAGEADLAIRVGPIDDDDLVVRPLGEMGSALYAATSYLERHPAPIDRDDLTGHDVIGYDASLQALPAAKWLEERAARATIVLRSRELADMVAAAVTGIGLALLPCQLAELEPALQRVGPEVLASRSVSLVYRREMRLSEPVKAVIRFVIDVMERNHAVITGQKTRWRPSP